MADIQVLDQYRKDQFAKVETVLRKSSELIAFIRVYGALYDNNYNAFILNLNNVNEHYLQNLDSQLIDKLYDVYASAKEENKSEKENFEQLRAFLYKLPVPSITEVSYRRQRHK